LNGNVILRTGTPVTLSSPPGGTDVETATASCSTGEKLIGGGYRLTGIDLTLDTPLPSENYPSSSTTWTTVMGLFTNTGQPGTLTVYVLCATS
jgi:hypothetical protein